MQQFKKAAMALHFAFIDWINEWVGVTTPRRKKSRAMLHYAHAYIVTTVKLMQQKQLGRAKTRHSWRPINRSAWQCLTLATAEATCCHIGESETRALRHSSWLACTAPRLPDLDAR